MTSYIPHKNNPHRLRSFVGSIAVVIFSVAVVFGVNFHLQKTRADVQPVQVENVEPTQKIQIASDLQAEETPFVVIDDEKVVDFDPQEIIPPPPIERDKNPDTRLDEAKLYARPSIIEGKYIDISLSHQNMVLFEDGKVLDAYLISSGKRGLDTPEGTFKIENKSPRAWSKAYSLWMPNWMAILPTGKIGIHELPVWPGGYQERASHLGTAVSHGCVRLGAGSAKKVYDWADIGTPVIVHK